MRVSSFPAMKIDQGKLIVIEDVGGKDREPLARGLVTALEERKREVLSVTEPTHDGIGAVIRTVIKKDQRFNARSVAQAHALDREVLYRKTVLPFLAAGENRVVIQEGGLISSLVYQTLQAEDEGRPITLTELLELPGNRLELSRRPDLILIIDPPYLEPISLRFRRKDILETFTRLGSRIIFIDKETLPDDVLVGCLPHLLATIRT